MENFKNKNSNTRGTQEASAVQNQSSLGDPVSYGEPYLPETSLTLNDILEIESRYARSNKKKESSPKTKHFSFCEICQKTVQTQIGTHYSNFHHVEKRFDGLFECQKCGEHLVCENVEKHKCTSPKILSPQKREMEKSINEFQEVIDETKLVRRCQICGFRIPNWKEHCWIYHPKNGLIGKRSACLICHQVMHRKYLSDHLKNQHHVKFIEKLVNDRDLMPNPRLIICLICGERMHPYEVLRHINKMHSVGVQRENSSPSQNVYMDTNLVSTQEKSQNSKVNNQTAELTDTTRTQFINNFLNEMAKKQVDTDINDGGKDGGKYLGWYERESGKFGSLPEYDDYSDESNA